MWNSKQRNIANFINPREGREKQKQISKTRHKMVEMSKNREFLNDCRKIALNYFKTEVKKSINF